MTSRYQAALLMLAAGLLPVQATAAPAPDSGGYIKPELSIGRAYDSNLFWSAANPQSDSIWRVSPGLEAGYRSDKFTMGAFSSIDAERYSQHPELNSNAIRRYTTLSLSYQQTPRWSESLLTAYTSTETPQQLTPVANLQLGRVHGSELTVHPEISYRFSSLMTGTFDYLHNRYELVGSPDTNFDTATVGATRQSNERNSFDVALSATRYDFATFDTVNSTLLLLGWKHRIAANTVLRLAAGPRRTDGSTTGEFALQVRHALETGSLSLGYTRSQTAVIGLTGPVDTKELAADLAYSVSPDMMLRFSPDYLRETNAGSEARLYRLNTSIDYRLNDYVSLLGSYQFSMQRGLFGSGADVEIKEHSVYLGLVFSLASSAGEVFTKRNISPFATSWPVSTKDEQRKQQKPPRQQ